MKQLKLGLFALSAIVINFGTFAQQPTNGGFENWQNVGSSTEEPTNWNGMMTGNLCGFCGLGSSQRIFRDGSVVHGGTYSCRIQSTTYVGNVINGTVTTGQVTAPSTTPSDGYNITLTGNSSFNHPFTYYPDSVVFWAKYNISTNADSARVSVTLHDNYDVRDPANTASQSHIVARAVKNFQTNGTTAWKRISVPFNYASYPATTTVYALATFTSSYVAGQGSGSAILWVDDMEFIYNPPVAGFTASASTVCAGTPVTFTNTTTSNTTATYSWDFGDGNNSTSANPSHTYASGGNYTVTLTSTNMGGSDTETFSITVNAAPSVAISGPSSVCSGSSVNLTASGATTYSWSNGLGTNATVSVTPTSNTTYTVTGTAAGCSAQSQISLTVDTQLSAGTPTPQTACVSATNINLFNGISGEDTGGTWSDDNSTGALSGSTFNPSLVSAGTYSFTYTHPANGACPPASTTTTVTVTNSVSAGSPTSNNLACTNDNAFDLFNTITGYTSGGDWNDDNNTGALTGNLFNATNMTPGTYNFTYSFAPGSCGSDSETITVTVSTPPTIGASNDVDICIGDQVTVTATGGLSYTWDNGLGAGASQTVSPSNTTTYTVTGMDANGCTATDAVMVTVHALPLVNAGADLTVCDGEQIVLSGQGASTYAWDNGVTNGIGFTQSAGTVTYTLTGTDAYGCVNTDQMDITALALPSVTIATFPTSTICTYNDPIAIPAGTPAGGYYSGAGVSGQNFDPSLVLPAIHNVSYVYTDTNGCTNFASTSIEVSLCLGLDELSTEFTIYPNPANNVINVVSTSNEVMIVEIIDAAGRSMKVSQFTGSTNIDVSSMLNGTYFIRLSDDSGNSTIEKLTIIR